MKNLVSWVEIPANDFEKAVEFYGKIFNLEFKIIDCGNEKMACFPGGEGAISKATGFKPSKNGLLVSFNTGKDINSVLEKVKKEGGEIIQTKTKIEAEGRGYFAIIFDNQGNKIGLYQD